MDKIRKLLMLDEVKRGCPSIKNLEDLLWDTPTTNPHSASSESVEGRISIGGNSPSSSPSVNQPITADTGARSVQSQPPESVLKLEDLGGSPEIHGNLPPTQSPLDIIPLEVIFGISLAILIALGFVLFLLCRIQGRLFLFLKAAILSICALSSKQISNALCDAAEPWQLGSQDAATPMMQGIIDLHHDIFFFLLLILVFVSRMLVRALWHFNEQTNPIPQRIVHGTTIEIIRTIFPSVILLFIAIPSFALLYSMDGVLVDPAITIKAIGHQWYRSAPLNEGDLSATKCTGGSRSIWLTGHLPFPSSRD
jgi:hypothetical protein